MVIRRVAVTFVPRSLKVINTFTTTSPECRPRRAVDLVVPAVGDVDLAPAGDRDALRVAELPGRDAAGAP
jgi:hypothetical protein